VAANKLGDPAPDRGSRGGDDASARLLSRLARGDEAALRELYAQFERRVYHYALRRLNDSFAAADIVNEVMLEVWKHADSYAGKSKVSTWMLGIARHKTIDYVRREQRHRADEYDMETPDDDAPAAADAIAALEDAERLARCMEALSDAHREAVHLAFFEQLPYAEIAAVTECPEGTVKTRIYHAKQLLKHCLERRNMA
jgi:RNA polymerase sigma-70 factor (ECF subfamily)